MWRDPGTNECQPRTVRGSERHAPTDGNPEIAKCVRFCSVPFVQSYDQEWSKSVNSKLWGVQVAAYLLMETQKLLSVWGTISLLNSLITKRVTFGFHEASLSILSFLCTCVILQNLKMLSIWHFVIRIWFNIWILWVSILFIICMYIYELFT